MKSVKEFVRRAWGYILRFFGIMGEDQITVYAAQSAFFLIVSSVPFAILLIGIARYVIDVDWLLGLISRHVGGEAGSILSSIVAEVVEKTGASLFSVIWSASRGVYSVTRGISVAYGVRLRENFIFDILRSLIYTLVFIMMIILSLVALVFAETIFRAARPYLPLPALVPMLFKKLAPVILTVLLTLFFALIYNTVSRKGRSFSHSQYKGLSGTLPRGFAAQLPGAVFASLGWVLFSYFFALYLRYFPGVSYLYGSLATLMILMLWVYSCMLILMIGAEINKVVFRKWGSRKRRKKQTGEG